MAKQPEKIARLIDINSIHEWCSVVKNSSYLGSKQTEKCILITKENNKIILSIF